MFQEPICQTLAPSLWDTSLVFGTQNQPGALSRCLEGLARRGLNLSKLESRPLGAEPWRYRFYLDVDAGLEEPVLQAAL